MTVTGENTVFYRYDNANRLTNVTQGTLTTSLAPVIHRFFHKFHLEIESEANREHRGSRK